MVPILMMVGLLGNQNTPKPSNYYIFPAHTQLQSELLPFRTDMVVFVNGTSSKKDPDELDIESLNLPGIEKNLREKNKNLNAVTFFVLSKKITKNNKIAEIEIKKVAVKADFKDSSVVFIGKDTEDSWENFTMIFTKNPKSEEDSENCFQNGRVKVFPVKTALSKSVFGNVDFLVALPAIEMSDTEIPKNIIESALKICKDKKINSRMVVLFSIKNNGKITNDALGTQLTHLD